LPAAPPRTMSAPFNSTDGVRHEPSLACTRGFANAYARTHTDTHTHTHIHLLDCLQTRARAHTHDRTHTPARLLANATKPTLKCLLLRPFPGPQIVEGKFRKVVDGVVDYDWKGF